MWIGMWSFTVHQEDDKEGCFVYYSVFKSWVFEHTITSCSLSELNMDTPTLQIVKIFSIVCGI